MSLRYGRDYDSIRDWYDGYEVSDIIPPDPEHDGKSFSEESLKPNRYSLYSPLFVVESMTTGRIKNYWNKTSTKGGEWADTFRVQETKIPGQV